MTLDIAITWLMFLGLFPISFFWLRRAYLICIRKDFSFVALKRGKPPEQPERYVLAALAINLVPGLVLAGTILLVLLVGLDYETWTATAGMTIWMKFLAEFILSRHAHLKFKRR